MTGNVMFLAFALAGAHGLSLPAVLVALTVFGAGALAGGPWGHGWAATAGSCSAPPPRCRLFC